MTKFYDKLAKKHKRYSSGAEYVPEYPAGNPEAVFKEKLTEVSGADKEALDIGCADGRFTLDMAPHFASITAIDTSEGMLDVAEGFKKERGVGNVRFRHAHAEHLPFPDGSFDVIINRRGPTFYDECARLLKPGGAYVEIRIGAKDAQALKEIFGRGQGLGAWDRDRRLEIMQEQREAGLEPTSYETYEYAEQFASRKELEKFLGATPIFEDFDPEQDKALLDRFEFEHSSEQGIRLDRERYVFVSKKAE